MSNTANTLACLPCGQFAFIKGMHVDGDLRTRLVALGLMSGKEVQVLRRASFGGPLHVRVGTTEIILRRQDAANILISSPQAQAA
jgi:ferrous iron transport protein A